MFIIGVVFKKIFIEFKVELVDYWVWGLVKGVSKVFFQLLNLISLLLIDLYVILVYKLMYRMIFFYQLMISILQSLVDKIRVDLMGELIDTYYVQGVCMVMQLLLVLYFYNVTFGIIVDIGERMEILFIYDGELLLGIYIRGIILKEEKLF